MLSLLNSYTPLTTLDLGSGSVTVYSGPPHIYNREGKKGVHSCEAYKKSST